MFAIPLRLKVTALLVAVGLLSGCAALNITTRQTANAVTSTTHGIVNVSHATTNVLVTQPDNAHYADAVAFARSQWPLLKREAARGGGEHIDALSALLDANGTTLGPWMQRHYAQLFPVGQRQAHALVTRLAARD